MNRSECLSVSPTHARPKRSDQVTQLYKQKPYIDNHICWRICLHYIHTVRLRIGSQSNSLSRVPSSSCVYVEWNVFDQLLGRLWVLYSALTYIGSDATVTRIAFSVRCFATHHRVFVPWSLFSTEIRARTRKHSSSSWLLCLQRRTCTAPSFRNSNNFAAIWNIFLVRLACITLYEMLSYFLKENVHSFLERTRRNTSSSMEKTIQWTIDEHN